jgi:gag-polypeptide of LTR copia-type
VHTMDSNIHPNPVDEKFNGSNYGMWSQSMELYIKGRNKLRHITGTPPLSTDPTYQKWELDDVVVKAWLINTIEPRLKGSFMRCPTTKEVWDTIATTFYDGSDASHIFDLNRRVHKLKQLGIPIEEYYNELQNLFHEIDARDPNLMECTTDVEKFNAYIQRSRVYLFLEGLDDQLDRARADVLQMVLFPSVEKTYGHIR